MMSHKICINEIEIRTGWGERFKITVSNLHQLKYIYEKLKAYVANGCPDSGISKNLMQYLEDGCPDYKRGGE